MIDRSENADLIERYQLIDEWARDIVLMMDYDGAITEANSAAVKAYGYPKDELLKMKINDLRESSTLSEFIEQCKRTKTEEILFETVHLRADGSSFPVEVNSIGAEIAGTRVVLSVIRDISERVQERKERLKVEEALRKSEEKYKSLFENMLDGFGLHKIILDEDGRPVDYVFLEINSAFEKLTGLKKEKTIGRKVSEVLPDIRDSNTTDWIKIYGEVALSGKSTRFVSYAEPVNKWYSISVFSLEKYYFATVFYDITEQRKAEEINVFLSTHDQLTGLYNRAYFEEALSSMNNEKYLPLSVIMGDVNGLKLVNDAFGHLEGDKLLLTIAQTLCNSCRCNDIIARWGGDEFVIVLPVSEEKTALEICAKIKRGCSQAKIDPIQPSIALGVSTKTAPDININKVFIEAESQMYKNKLIESKSIRKKIIASLEFNMYERSCESREHTERMQNLASIFGKELKLNDSELKKLVNFARLHDIGKIGIPPEILSKRGPLLLEEWQLIKKHSEIGFRIAQSSPALACISEEILAHHEKWDGSGYPRGIEADEIPVLAQIIAIVDAYDVMTHDCCYKKAKSHNEAIKEIKRCAGTHFNPNLAELFVNMF